MTLRRWFITGASRGLGRAFTEAALDAGDVVIATARKPETLEDLAARHGDRFLALPLDVTDRAAVFDAVATAVGHKGGIDVLVPNAGYGLAGAVEEVTERQVRDQMDVNFFGSLWTVQAALPVMREQQSGHILQISSIAALTAYPNLSMYCASKWALDGMSDALAQEVESFGIKVTIVELGEFRTDWSAGSLVRANPMREYDDVLAKRRTGLSGAYANVQPGDPAKAAQALRTIVEAEEPPRRVLLGNGCADLAPKVYRERIEEWQRWDELARSADFAGS